MTERICANCIHKAGFDMCFHPRSYRGPSFVKSPPPPGFYNSDEWFHCGTMRSAPGACGEKAHLFEEIPPFRWPWQRQQEEAK